MAAASTYRLPKPDGSYMEGVTVKDGFVYGPSGKKLGKVSMFPDLQDGNGARVEDTSSTPTVLTAPATNSEGVTREEGIEATKTDLETELRNDERTNSNGIKQRGMTLGGIKQFNEQYGLEVADGSALFNLNGSNGQTGDNSNDYSVGDAAVMGVPLSQSGPIKQGGFVETVISPDGVGESVPHTLGQTDNPQNGASSTPDNEDQSRALAMKPFRGSERQREFRDRPGNRPPVSAASETKGNGSDKARNAYASAFLSSTAKGPMGVLREASAAQGVIRTNDGGISIRDGDGYRTYTGDKSAREVAFDLGGGQKGYDKHAGDFTSIGVPDKPEVKPDDEQTPATPWSGMSMDEKKGAVTAYAQDFANTFKDSLKNKNK